MKKIKLWFQENLRLVIHRFPVAYRACLLFVKTYGRVYYVCLDKKYHYRAKLRALKGSKVGQRCFIIGNGPSLKTEDLEKLIHEDCFGANKLYKIFSDTEWRPKYYTVIDWHGLDSDVADSLEVEKLFFGEYYWRKNKLKRKDAVIFYGDRILDTQLSSFQVSEDISDRIYIGATVTYACMQIAAYLGYTEIYLLGIDHNYAYISDDAGRVVCNEQTASSHFYQDNDSTKVYADAEGMTNAYIAFKAYADKHGIAVKNATRGGKLEVFERVDFDDLMGRGRLS